MDARISETLNDLRLRRWDRVSPADVEEMDAAVRALQAERDEARHEYETGQRKWTGTVHALAAAIEERRAAKAARDTLQRLAVAAFEAAFTNDSTPPGHYLVPAGPMCDLYLAATGKKAPALKEV